jgi:hypothetical protein
MHSLGAEAGSNESFFKKKRVMSWTFLPASVCYRRIGGSLSAQSCCAKGWLPLVLYLLTCLAKICESKEYYAGRKPPSTNFVQTICRQVPCKFYNLEACTLSNHCLGWANFSTYRGLNHSTNISTMNSYKSSDTVSLWDRQCGDDMCQLGDEDDFVMIESVRVCALPFSILESI